MTLNGEILEDPPVCPLSLTQTTTIVAAEEHRNDVKSCFCRTCRRFSFHFSKYFWERNMFLNFWLKNCIIQASWDGRGDGGREWKKQNISRFEFGTFLRHPNNSQFLFPGVFYMLLYSAQKNGPITGVYKTQKQC